MKGTVEFIAVLSRVRRVVWEVESGVGVGVGVQERRSGRIRVRERKEIKYSRNLHVESAIVDIYCSLQLHNRYIDLISIHIYD